MLYVSYSLCITFGVALLSLREEHSGQITFALVLKLQAYVE